MKLIDFSIAPDFIGLELGSYYFDLHNRFEFQGLSYDPVRRTLELQWRRGPGESVGPAEPSRLYLDFADVYLFRAQERDPEVPFTEDDCLDTIGFFWDADIAEMSRFTTHRPSEGCTHLVIIFMSGFSIKVGAASASLRAMAG